MKKQMKRADRAKQFMPFAALKGYEEALREKERIVVPRIELTEDAQEDLNRKLLQVRKNDIITATYYQNGTYVQMTGMVTRIDVDAKILRIVKTNIPLGELLEVKRETRRE